jgi:hypothetical protein
MAKVDNPPFGHKQRDLEVHEWSRPVSDLDIPAIKDKAVCEAVRKKASHAGKVGVEKRREAPRSNPIIEFITNKLKRTRDISSRDMEAALKDEAENANVSEDIMMSPDGTAFVVMDNGGKEKNRLAITSLPPTISRIRKKISKAFGKIRLIRADDLRALLQIKERG